MDSFHQWLYNEYYKVDRIVEIIYRDGRREIERNLGGYDAIERFTKAIVKRHDVESVVTYEPISQRFQ